MELDFVELKIYKTHSITFESNTERVYGVEEAGPIFSSIIGCCNTEKVAVLCLDHTSKILNMSIVAMGQPDQVQVSIAQIIRTALLSNASRIVVGHNHPSGVLEITTPDIALTKRLIEASNLFGITLIDSIIVNSESDFISIRREIEKHEG